MLIRPATVADVPAVLPMADAICAMHKRIDPERYGYVPDIMAKYGRWLPNRAADATSVFLVAEVEAADAANLHGIADASAGSLSGYLVATTEENVPIYTPDRYGFIHDVWVEEPWRRHGVARGLTLAAMERFRAMGVEQVRLETLAGNERARKLFVSCGLRASVIDMVATVAKKP